MKNFLPFMLLLFSFQVMGNDQEECALNTEYNDLLFDFFDSGCLKLPENERCACLEKEKPTNFIMAELDKKENIKVYQEKQKQKRTDQFWKSYSQMTHGAALQTEVIYKEEMKNEDPNQKFVGCPPTQLADKYQEKLDHHINALKDKKDKSSEQVLELYKTCLAENKAKVEKCSHLKKVLSKIDSDVMQPREEMKSTICATTAMNNMRSTAKINLEHAKAAIEGSNLSAEDKKRRLLKIQCYKLKMNSTEADEANDYNHIGCVEVLGPLPIQDGETANYMVTFDQKKMPVVIAGENECDLTAKQQLDLFSEIESFKQSSLFLNDKKLFAEDHLAKIGDRGTVQSECKSSLCRTFEDANRIALSKMEQAFIPTENTCVSYPEFIMRKGIPGDALMQELANLPDNKLASALEVPKSVNTQADQERLNFLRSNPLLAKIALDPNSRAQLAKELQTIAKSGKNKSPADKLKNYLSFMKGPVWAHMKQDSFKGQQEFICNQMINSYTAIQVSTDLPPLTGNPTTFPLQAAIRTCNIEMNNLISVTDSVGSLEMDNLLREVPGDMGGKTEEEYAAMNKKYCGNYASFKKGCKKDAETCRKEYLATTEFKDEQRVMDKMGAARNYSGINFARVQRQSQASYQDEHYKKWWDKNVGKKLSQNAVPYKDSMDEFAYNKSQDLARASQLSESNPEQLKSSATTPTNVMASLKEAPGITSPVPNVNLNPGQVLPTYGGFDPSKLVEGQSVTNAITNFDTMPASERIENLEEAKDYLEDNRDKLESDDLEEKLADAKEQIEHEKEEQKKLEQRLAQMNSSLPQFSQGTNLTAPVSQPVMGGGVQAPIVTPGVVNAGFAKANGIENKVSNTSAMNEALKYKHEQVSRSPSSVKDPVDFEVKSGVVPTEELQGELVISQELKAQDNKEFEELSKSSVVLESWLEAHLGKSDLTEGKIISIRDPSNVMPVRHLIYKIKLVNGKYEIRSLPLSVKVERPSNSSNTLERLNKSLPKKQKAI